MNRWQPCCSGDATDTCLGGRHFGSSQAWVVHDRLGGLDVHAAYLLDVGYNRIHDDRPPPMNSGNSLVTSKANSGLLQKLASLVSGAPIWYVKALSVDGSWQFITALHGVELSQFF